MKQDVEGLAERVEAATGADRELFEQAWVEIHVGLGGDLNVANWPSEKRLRWARFQELLGAGAYLDAAMTLVPEGWSVSVGELRGVSPPLWRAHLRDHRPESLTAEGHSQIWVEGNTPSGPALALTAAALRARARDDGQGGRG